MGWKIFTAFIKGKNEIDINEDFIASIGFRGFKFIEETEFDFGPNIGELYVAKRNGNILISNADLIWQFTKPKTTKTEKLFLSTFPNSEVAIINLGYGSYFSVLENGKKVRTREVGDEVYLDIGELLPEEKSIKTEDLIHPEDLEEMKRDCTPEEIENEIQSNLAYETCFELTKRFFGKRFDELNAEDYKFPAFKFVNKDVEFEKDYGKKAELQFEK